MTTAQELARTMASKSNDDLVKITQNRNITPSARSTAQRELNQRANARRIASLDDGLPGYDEFDSRIRI